MAGRGGRVGGVNAHHLADERDAIRGHVDVLPQIVAVAFPEHVEPRLGRSVERRLDEGLLIRSADRNVDAIGLDAHVHRALRHRVRARGERQAKQREEREKAVPHGSAMDVESGVARIDFHGLLQRRAAAGEIAEAHADHPRVVGNVGLAHAGGERFFDRDRGFLQVAFRVLRPRQRVPRVNAVAALEIALRELQRLGRVGSGVGEKAARVVEEEDLARFRGAPVCRRGFGVPRARLAPAVS